jgi:prepilin-type N-terminal cleavage/methylation domain-containing protein
MKTHAKNHQAGFTLIEVIVGLVVAAIMASMVYTYFGSALTQSSVPIARLQKASNLQQVMENIVADYNRLNAINLRYKWIASTAYTLDSVVTPKTIPATPDGGHYYKCTVAGASGTNEPTWPVSGTVSEGPSSPQLTWTESGNIIWQKSHPYAVGAIVVPILNNGHYYKCTVAGTSNTTNPPVWLTTAGATVLDGTAPNQITWIEVGTILSSAEVSIENLSTLLPSVGATSARYGTGYTVTEKAFIGFDNSNPRQETTATENNILKVTIKNNDSSETLTQLFTIR